MSRVRGAISIGVLLLLLSVAPLIAASPTEAMSDPVRDCPRGLVCFSIKEAAKIDRKLAELDRLKRTKRLLGIHVTCGIGIAGIATDKFDLKAAPAGFCGVGYGW